MSEMDRITNTPHAKPGQGQHGLWVLKNYKRFFLHSEERGPVRRSLRAHAKRMRESDQSCLLIDDSGKVCRRLSKNRSHLIPKQAILSELADSQTGKVLELRWSLAAWTHTLSTSNQANSIDMFSADTFQPRNTPLETGIGNAAVGHYACLQHDREVFGPIDVARPDFHSREVMLLTVYRTLLFLADIARGAEAMMFDPEMNAIAREHESPEIRMDWERQKQSPPFTLLKPSLSEFRDIWKNRRSTVSLTGSPITFRSRLRFATCGILHNALQVVCVLPIAGDNHQLIIIQVGPEDRSAKAIRERLESTAVAAQRDNSEDIRLICEIMRWSGGTAVASIASFDSITGWERRQIQALIGHNSGARNIYAFLEPRLRGIQGSSSRSSMS